MELGAIDGLVVADVDVVGIFANLKLVDIGNVSEVLVLRGSSDTDVTVLGGFLACLLAPGAGKNIVSLALLKQVHGNGGELRPSATLQEENLVIVGNAHQIAQVGLSLIENLLECLGAMGHLHNGHARAAVIQHLSCGLLKHADGKRGGTGGKVVNPCHVNRPFNGVEPEARRWCNTPTLANLAQARRFFWSIPQANSQTALGTAHANRLIRSAGKGSLSRHRSCDTRSYRRPAFCSPGPARL